MTFRHSTRFGIACMTGYVLLFVITNMITMGLTQSLPLAEIAFFRYLVAVPVILVPDGRGRCCAAGEPCFRPHRARRFSRPRAASCGYHAIAVLPLGDATALFYLGPLLVTGGAALLLRERPGALRVCCVLAGFAGVILIAQPHATHTAGVLAGAGNALCARRGRAVDPRRPEHRGAGFARRHDKSAVCTVALAPLAAAAG